MDTNEFEDMLSEYWDAAYTEGTEGRTHDTKDGRAQRALSALREHHDALRVRLAEVEAQSVHIYNSGYHAGHHDTVEGRYVDIHPSDMASYHVEEVSELRDALAKLEAHDGK